MGERPAQGVGPPRGPALPEASSASSRMTQGAAHAVRSTRATHALHALLPQGACTHRPQAAPHHARAPATARPAQLPRSSQPRRRAADHLRRCRSGCGARARAAQAGQPNSLSAAPARCPPSGPLTGFARQPPARAARHRARASAHGSGASADPHAPRRISDAAAGRAPAWA
jgi:hypothetical protein